ncbi:S9 family peptidase [Aquimarina litoralis]|uniref:S9 family peptidase n=1 Tax=Aquimarina litoralis TaxID=584605 RepID=UPI001C584DF6|nr:S9 family peptidase [Aquimarina litoralis]MBW1296466.1 prolyl oligopeptidase family serine peptidase [Aquimarina litoralis]
MKTKIINLLLFASILLIGCKAEKEEKTELKPHESLKAPVAKKIAEELKAHGDTRIDNYFWMRLSDEQKNAETPDAQTQDVLDYLNAENDYKDAAMKHTDSLQKTLFDEIVGRIKKDDSSVPYSDNGYSYYNRFEKGMNYALYCRKKLEDGAKEEIMLNGPEMAKGLAYFALGGLSVSPNNEMISYGIDTVSRRRYTIYFKDLANDKMLSDKLENTTGGVAWANDNKTVFYTSKDPITLRANKIYKHVLGTDQSQDVLIFDEKDDTFSTFVYKSRSDKYIISGSFQTLSTEYRYLDADTPNGEWKVIQPRERDLEYSVSHYGDHFYIRTNLDAKNFKLVKTPVNATTKENWEDVIPHRDDVLLQGFTPFKNHLVLSERKDGLSTIRVRKWDGNDDHYISFNDPAYLSYTSTNLDFDTNILRYGYTSLTTPNSVIDYNMDTKEQTVLKEQEVLDPNFSKDNYVSERLYATAKDGVKVPISLVYKKGTQKNANTPLLLYSYGSYGSSTEPRFSSTRLSLLDRGFVYAIAHIRGGQEMGRHWYEDGKLLKKKNTFTDFIDAGDFLVKEGYTSADHMYAYGGSAGGLLMGAILNMKPELWNGVVAAVPFVDVVSTMMDETIPLTTFEFDEWGNPKNKEYYEYMKSYSPYDNVEAKDYPNILITTGYWDSQVQYWEPAKWIAKLRELKTDNNLLIMDCDMETGHGGASGRFDRYKSTALNYAFMLDLEGIDK